MNNYIYNEFELKTKVSSGRVIVFYLECHKLINNKSVIINLIFICGAKGIK